MDNTYFEKKLNEILCAHSKDRFEDGEEGNALAVLHQIAQDAAAAQREKCSSCLCYCHDLLCLKCGAAITEFPNG